MANFSNTYSDAEFEIEEQLEALIKSHSPADAAKEIVSKVFAPLIESLEDTCPVDCDHCRD